MRHSTSRIPPRSGTRPSRAPEAVSYALWMSASSSAAMCCTFGST